MEPKPEFAGGKVEWMEFGVDLPSEETLRALLAPFPVFITNVETVTRVEPTENERWASRLIDVLEEIGTGAADMADTTTRPSTEHGHANVVQARAIAIQRGHRPETNQQWWREIAMLAVVQLMEDGEHG